MLETAKQKQESQNTEKQNLEKQSMEKQALPCKAICGLEIHQQLNTKKLFCNCSSELSASDKSGDSQNKHSIIVYRSLRTTASELGFKDVAALHEQEKGLTYQYISPLNNSCLVELDEEPPHNPNPEALKIALQVSSLLNAKPVHELHFMRKIVIDGSNTAGFQRTGLIATNGFVKTSQGNVRIATICLEEDAARKVELEHKNKNIASYNLDRLGIPLVEITTEPDITNGFQLRQVAEHIGLLLRSCNVKRGIGTIRQDVNISTEVGARVEIKGAQDLKLLPKIFELEVHRQFNLYNLKPKIEKCLQSFEFKPVDVSHVFQNTGCKFISKALASGAVVLGLKLPFMKNVLGFNICDGKRLATELADFIKAKTPVKGLIHSDELPGYGISQREVDELCKALNVNSEDGFVIITGEKAMALKCLNLVVERLKQFAIGVPAEVRKANKDGTTSYLRPLPGSARMYPETDIPPINLESISFEKPLTVLELAQKMQDKGIPKDLALISAKNKIPVLEFCNKFPSLKPSLIAEVLVSMPKEVKTRTGKAVNVLQYADKLFEMLASNVLTRKGVFKTLEKLAVEGIFKPEDFKTLSLEELKSIVEESISNVKQQLGLLGLQGLDASQKHLFAKQVFETIMRTHGKDGRINPKQLMQVINDKLSMF
ncbi:Glu-tRNA(Gln) amidotransferase subunit GatE [Candidatus Woesearchaeota archaeon]|nr:Glu-tRNA(Gln) amidotransferase subunit GatE [Candidatus Woesearchaeota archaeon]